jgi:hypothetical protein
MANQGDMPVGDADRDAAAARLREHFAAGRLTLEEFQDRLGAVFTATTSRELAQVTADLPHDGVYPGMRVRASAAGGWPGPAGGSPGPAGRWPGPSGGWPAHSRRRVRGHGRRRLRFRSRVLLACAAVAAFWLLIGFSLPHNGLLIAAFIVMLGFMGLAVGLVAGLIWLARRAWRRGAWMEGLPLLFGAPWLGRALWAGRAMWIGHSAWRAGSRFRPAYPGSPGGRPPGTPRSPLRGEAGAAGGASRDYPAAAGRGYPAGTWPRSRS